MECSNSLILSLQVLNVGICVALTAFGKFYSLFADIALLIYCRSTIFFTCQSIYYFLAIKIVMLLLNITRGIA